MNPRVLIISPQVFPEPRSGVGMRGHFQAMHLSQRWPVTLVTEAGVFEVADGKFTCKTSTTAPELASHRAYVKSLVTRRHYLYEKYNCRRWAVPRLDQFTHVIVHYSALLSALNVDRKHLPTIIFDTHNNEREYFESVAAESKNPISAMAIRGEASVAERIIRSKSSLIAATISVSEADRDWVTSLCLADTPHYVVPNNLFRYDPAKWTGSKTILFVGTLSVTMNLQALDWFVSNVWPAIKSAASDVVFVVAGRDPSTELVSRLRSKGIDVVANAASLRDLYGAAMCAVVPALSGSGAKIKVAEALSFGVPVITTTHGVVGQPVAIKECCIVRDDAAGWIESIVAQASYDRRSTEQWDLKVKTALGASYFGSSIGQIVDLIDAS